MTITPVTPIDVERLVPTNTSIIIDTTDNLTLVTVNAVTVWDGGFQNGWSGSLLNHPSGGGKRLVLDPPSLFTVGQLVQVFAADDEPSNLDYQFLVGTEQLTITDDADSPRITEAATATYIGYVRTEGQLKLRFADPVGVETQVVEGEIVDIGYDATLNKFVIFFINNGKVFVSTADPGDTPTTLAQPSALVNDLKHENIGSGYQPSDLNLVNFPPIKQPILETQNSAIGTGYNSPAISDFPRGINPSIISAPPNPVVVRFPRPTDEPENNLIVGVIPLKFVPGGGFNALPFIPFPDDLSTNFIDFEDPIPTIGARYAAIAIYRPNEGGGTVRSPIGGRATIPTAADIQNFELGGGHQPNTLNLVNFPPIKQPVLETLEMPTIGSGHGVGFTSTGFPPIGVG